MEHCAAPDVGHTEASELCEPLVSAVSFLIALNTGNHESTSCTFTDRRPESGRSRSVVFEDRRSTSCSFMDELDVGRNEYVVSEKRAPYKRQLVELEHQEDYPTERNTRPSDNINQLFDMCRQQALDRISTLKNVFVLDACLANEYLLQVKLTSEEVYLSMNVKPWSTVLGMPAQHNDFKTVPNYHKPVFQSLLKGSSKEFSPTRIVRFILDNCDGEPIIVSNNFTNLMNKFDGEMSFMDYIAYLKQLPGSQRCCKGNCNQMGSSVHVGIDNLPRGIYCAKHVRQLDIYDQVLLYNPLLVSFTTHLNKSVMWIIEVYGPRLGYHTTMSPKPLPRKWIPLCTKYQEYDLKSTRRSERCRRNVHCIGVDDRHSITCRLLKSFLKKSGTNELCKFRYEEWYE